MQIKISVRDFVEFLFRSGSIDRRIKGFDEDALQKGSKIHRAIQKSMKSNYHPEVSLSYCRDWGEYSLLIEGRADGIIDQETITIDEIKSTYLDLNEIEQPALVHLAQAKCYAFFYLQDKELNLDETITQMDVQITYCHIESLEIKRFLVHQSREELESWFEALIAQYEKWAKDTYEWDIIARQSSKRCSFPFSYREGQKELITHVYHTICHKRKLFLQAPTGVGKTIATIFPSIKAFGEGKADKIFYFTAKTITSLVALEAYRQLRDIGLNMRTIVLTAKEKICFEQKCDCVPEKCIYANGHYDRINDAVFDLITSEEDITKEVLCEYARKHTVCPFEMGLDVSLYCDGIILDYNYLFDPYSYLRRYFMQGGQGNYLFLIDEAHNLVDRSRDMYSAMLIKEEFLEVKREVKKLDKKTVKCINACNKELLALKKLEIGKVDFDQCSKLLDTLIRLNDSLVAFMNDNIGVDGSDLLLSLFFKIKRFMDVYEKLDDCYASYTQILDDGTFQIKLYCFDPSAQLRECLNKGVSSILFSATLLPIQYYKGLLGGTGEDYEVYAESDFPVENRKILICSGVTSKYSNRNFEEYRKIANYIYEIVTAKNGNYIVFFPSFLFLNQVYSVFETFYYERNKLEVLLQKESMNEDERDYFIGRFSYNTKQEYDEKMIRMPIEKEADKTILGFCVLGGVFGEGIDLKEDMLIGAIIIGTGTPQISYERELLRKYFDKTNQAGFDYAYRYPGMNKVLQAAGRVIRTKADKGVIALLDDRFRLDEYNKLFPKEWNSSVLVDVNSCRLEIEKFWNHMLLNE